MIFIRGSGFSCLNNFVSSLYVVEKGRYDKKLLRNTDSLHLPVADKVGYFIHRHHEHQQYVTIGRYSHTWRMWMVKCS